MPCAFWRSGMVTWPTAPFFHSGQSFQTVKNKSVMVCVTNKIFRKCILKKEKKKDRNGALYSHYCGHRGVPGVFDVTVIPEGVSKVLLMYQKCILRDSEVLYLYLMYQRCLWHVQRCYGHVTVVLYLSLLMSKMSDVFLYAVPMVIYCWNKCLNDRSGSTLWFVHPLLMLPKGNSS